MTIEATRPVTTLSGEPVEALYGPEDVGPFEERIGYPGAYPFTRGVYETIARGFGHRHPFQCLIAGRR